MIPQKGLRKIIIFADKIMNFYPTHLVFAISSIVEVDNFSEILYIFCVATLPKTKRTWKCSI